MNSNPLRRLAAFGASEPSPASMPCTGTRYDADAFRRANDDDLAALDVHPVGDWKRTPEGHKQVLEGCPYSRDHRDGVARFQMPSGYIEVICKHDRCSGKRLKDHIGHFPRSHEVKSTSESFGSGTLNAGEKRVGAGTPSTGTDADDDPGDAVEWETPLPLDPTTGTPFPVDTLPCVIGDLVAAVAEETQTPADLAALVALSVVSAAAGGKYTVFVSSSSWYEPVHTMMIPTIGPGNRKSGVFQRLTPPLRTWEAEKQAEDAAKIDEWLSVEKVLIKQLDAEERAAGKPTETGTPRAPKADAHTLRQATVHALREHRDARPVETEVYTDDATPEAVKERLINQGGAFAILSAESAFLSIAAGGRYSTKGEPNLDVILNGHAGDEIKTTRKGQRTERTSRACLTLCLMLQPHVVSKLGGVEGFADRGAAARLLPAFPADYIGHRRIHTTPVSDALMNKWDHIIRAILDTSRTGEPRTLLLAPDALQLFNAYREGLEPMLKSEGPRMADWLNKLAGAVLRLAGLLHVAMWERPEDHPIDAATIRAGIAIGTYFHHHARIMFRLMFGRGGKSDAAAILEVLRDVARADGDRITSRNLWQRVKNRSGFDRSDLDDALSVLEDAGYVRREITPAKRGNAPGGRRSEVIHLHPDLRSQNSQNSSQAPPAHRIESIETGLSAIVGMHCDSPEPLPPTGTDGLPEWEVT
jgi:hypothetical protein